VSSVLNRQSTFAARPFFGELSGIGADSFRCAENLRGIFWWEHSSGIPSGLRRIRRWSGRWRHDFGFKEESASTMTFARLKALPATIRWSNTGNASCAS